VTRVSPTDQAVALTFFRNAAAIYGEKGLAPSTAGSAGLDLRACFPAGEAVIIPPGERRSLPSGIAVAPLEPGIAAFVYSRSGLGAIRGLTVAQGVGLIDPDYRGEIVVILLNTGQEKYAVRQGERIAQLVFQPFVRPQFRIEDSLEETERGTGAFGHTGKE
jgi:dUTP pyrophosphatase